MKMNRRRFIGVTATLTGGLLTGTAVAADRKSGFVVAGYLPDYRLSPKNLARAKGLTDLIAFSAEPRETGELELRSWNADAMKQLRQARTDHGCRILICVGGGERSEHFRNLLDSSLSRDKLVQAVTSLCEREQLDGIDLDWEHPDTNGEARNYSIFMEQLKASIGSKRIVTAAVATHQDWFEDSARYLDRVHVMAYDMPQQHSTVQGAENAVNSWLKRGVPADKICLGIPLYGRGVTSRERTMAYADLLTRPNFKEGTDEWDGLYYNGPKTVSAKVALAKRMGLGGVFVWEVGQDAEGDKSLLQSIKDAAKA
ncbi:MAG TPA: glycoside hydrolase family 18 protein [Verrucomicrobiae bacterium]